METLETLRGNTSTLKEEKKRVVPGKKWCFTAFGSDMEMMEISLLNNPEIKYIAGREKCPTTGEKHLQGYVEYNAKIRPVEFFGTKTVHWEKSKGSREQNMKYCMKEGDYRTNLDLPELIIDPMIGLTWYGWQFELQDILEARIDSRTIYWFYETVGNVGKTTFCKHLCMQFSAIYVSGKAADVKCGIVDYKKSKGFWPRIVLWDIPRTVEDYVSYSAIEEVKNGIFFSGKYESGMAVFNSPHVIVFANFVPDIRKMSLDRWQIKNIGIDKCLTSTEEYMSHEELLMPHEPMYREEMEIEEDFVTADK